MAQYPSSVASFDTRLNGQTIDPSHMNDVQAEIEAITTALLQGFAHNLIPAVTATRDLGVTGTRWRDLFLSRDAVVAGTVTAGAFVGDGSGLTGVSGVASLDDLTDVILTGPANGDFLQFDGSDWVNGPLPGGGAPSLLDDLLDVDAPSPTTGDLLQWDGANWVPASLSGFRTGDMKYSFQATPEAGWGVLQGQAVSRSGDYAAVFALFGTTYGAGNGTTTFNLPDLSRRVVIGRAASAGQSTVGAMGGAFDHTHTGPAHTHDVGTLAVASHNHGVGTLAVDAHAHAAGTLTGAGHTHGPGTLATASHGHPFSGTTSSDGSHTHSTPAHTHTGTTDGPSGVDTFNEGNDASHSPADENHTHTFTTDSGGAGTTGADGAHTHTYSGNTDSQTTIAVNAGVTASQTVSVTGSTASATPNVSGNTGATAPAITGTSASAGTGATGANNPLYIVLNCFIKL